MAVANSLVLAGVPAPVQARRVFERSLIASLGGGAPASSVGYNLRAVRAAGSSVRERLSQEHWNMIVRAQEDLAEACEAQTRSGEFSTMQALDILKDAGRHMAAITGAQTDRMTRDDGWRLLSIGRHIERLGFLARSLALGLETASVHTEAGFEAMVALFDSTITFHAQFQQSREMAAMIDLLVLDRDNPRSLAWVAHTLRGRLAKLAGSEPNELSALSLQVPNPNSWNLDQLCMFDTLGSGTDRQPMTALANLLDQCNDAAFDVSEVISATYFTHSGESRQSVGA